VRRRPPATAPAPARSGRRRLLAWPLAALLIVALHALGAWGVLRLHFNNAIEVYFPADSPALQLRAQLRRDFPSDEILTVMLRGSDLYGADVMQRLDRLVADLGRHPLVDRVTTLTSIERLSATEDGFAVGWLVDAAKAASEPTQARRDRVLGDRFAPGMLASRDGKYLAIAVRPKLLDESAQRAELRAAALAAISHAGLAPYLVADAGPVSLDVAQLESIFRDTAIFVPLTVALGLALLWWVVGRVRPVLVGAVAMSTVVAPTVGAIALAGQPYTMASAILPSLLSAYTMATLLHLYAAVQRAYAAGLTRPDAIDRALGETYRPGLYNVLTTGAGLLSLLLVPIPPVQVFGVAGAAGTALVFVTVFHLVPPLLARWDGAAWPGRASGMGRLGRLASRLALFSLRHPLRVVATAVVVAVACLPLLQRVQVESDITAFFEPQAPVSQATRLVESKLSGVTSLEISLTGAADRLQNVQALKAMRELQRWLEQLPEVDRTVSMADIVEEMHWAMNDEKPEFRTLPDNDRLLRQYLLVYDGSDLFELVDRDFRHARILLNLNVHGTQGIGRVIEQIRERVAAQPLPGLAVDVGGQGRLFADQAALLVDGQINSFAGAFAQIFLLMWLLWRSFGAAAICLLPNLAPLYFVFVLMGATGISLDLATVMIASLVLGITIDDTIHLYHSYKHRRDAGIAPVLAIARSFESSGRAVLATSVLLISQFALLSTSSFVPTANFGLMTAVGLAAGQLFELLLLPALLLLKDTHWRASPRPVQRARSPSPAASPGSPSDLAATLPVPAEAAPRRLLVCRSGPCNAAGAAAMWKHLSDEHERLDLASTAPALMFTRSSCLGPCKMAPVVQVYPEGVYYCAVDTLALDRVLDEHLLAGQVVEELAYRPGDTRALP
jgi:predicted RND superfamily exporter protein/(2Fe-2S) ferredoxin